MSLGDALRQMYADGQRRWPSVELEYEQFERHCVAVLGPEPSSEVQQFGADLYLCCGCAARDPEATLAFERETMAVARAAILRVHRHPDFVNETLRELWDKLLFAHEPRVAEYSARGSIYAWTRVAAARAAIDRCRARRVDWGRQVDLVEHLGAAGGAGPESTLTKAQYAEAFQRALEHALEQLSARDRNLLRMHVLDHCSIDQIGRAHGVHRATAARWLERARASVLDAIRSELRLAGSALTDSEFKSVAHLMGSELELSLPRDPKDSTGRPLESGT